MPKYCHGTSYNIVADHGTHFTEMKCIVGPMLVKSFGFTLFPIILKQWT